MEDNKKNLTPEQLIKQMERGDTGTGNSLYEDLGTDAIPVLQGELSDRAEQLFPTSTRFIKEPGIHGNTRIITDLKTNRAVEISLCHYQGALKAIQAFFPES